MKIPILRRSCYIFVPLYAWGLAAGRTDCFLTTDQDEQ
jgi:hypothetical protein